MTPEQKAAAIEAVKNSDLYLPIKMRRIEEIMEIEITEETPSVADALAAELNENPTKAVELARALGIWDRNREVDQA